MKKLIFFWKELLASFWFVPVLIIFDEDAKPRVIADVLDFEGVMDVAFNQIRQFSEGSTAVIIRLMEALITILNIVRTESHKKAVIKHAEMVYRQGKEAIREENDLQDLLKRADEILKK